MERLAALVGEAPARARPKVDRGTQKAPILAIGAWILGTGGGGSPYLALLNMRKLYREGVVCSLLDPMDLGDDARAGRWRGRNKTECGIHTITTS